MSEEITSQKEELAKVKKERAQIVKNIDSEKTKISKEFVQQKRQLADALVNGDQHVVDRGEPGPGNSTQVPIHGQAC